MTESQSLPSDIWNSFKDRFSGQVTGSFTFIWLIFNWRVPVFLFSGSISPYERINGISEIYGGGRWQNWMHLLLVPAFATFVYLISVEILRAGHFWYQQYWKKVRKLKTSDDDKDVEAALSYYTSHKNLLGLFDKEFTEDLNDISQMLKACKLSLDRYASEKGQSITDLHGTVEMVSTYLKSYVDRIGRRQKLMSAAGHSSFKASDIIRSIFDSNFYRSKVLMPWVRDEELEGLKAAIDEAIAELRLPQ